MARQRTEEVIYMSQKPFLNTSLTLRNKYRYHQLCLEAPNLVTQPCGLAILLHQPLLGLPQDRLLTELVLRLLRRLSVSPGYNNKTWLDIFCNYLDLAILQWSSQQQLSWVIELSRDSSISRNSGPKTWH